MPLTINSLSDSSSNDSSYLSYTSSITDTSEQSFVNTSFDICDVVRSEKPPNGIPGKMKSLSEASSNDNSHSSYASLITDTSEQTFANTSFDICQVIRSEKPPNGIPEKMELKCDGFEVVRTKDNIGFDECLRKLEDARQKLKGMNSGSAVLTYNSYAIAHEREKERRKTNKKNRILRYEIEKQRRLQLKFQGHKNNLVEIKELSPRHEGAQDDLENKMFKCKGRLNESRHVILSERLDKSREINKQGQTHFRSSSRQNQRESPNDNTDQLRSTEVQSSSWFGSFIPFFKSSSNSIINCVASTREEETTEKDQNLHKCDIPTTVSIPTSSIYSKSLPPLRTKYAGKLNGKVHLSTSTRLDKGEQKFSTKRGAVEEEGNIENVLCLEPSAGEKEVTQMKVERIQENGATQNKVGGILLFTTNKSTLSWSGSYYTTESSSKSSKSFRQRRVSRNMLKEKAQEILAKSCNSLASPASVYSESEVIKHEEVEKPDIISPSVEALEAASTISSEERGNYGTAPKVDSIPPNKTPCNTEMEDENHPGILEEKSIQDNSRLARRNSFPRPPRRPFHMSCNDSLHKKKSSSQSADNYSMDSLKESSDENKVITFEDSFPYGKVQLIYKSPTDMGSQIGSHMDSTINTTQLHDSSMENLIITFSSGSANTMDNSEDHSKNSRGSRRKRYNSYCEVSRDDCSSFEQHNLDCEVSRDDCSSFEPLEPYTIADGAPLNAFIGTEMASVPVDPLRRSRDQQAVA